MASEKSCETVLLVTLIAILLERLKIMGHY